MMFSVLDEPDLVFLKDGNTYILDSKSSSGSESSSDMTLLIAIDTPSIVGREPLAIQSSSLYSALVINSVLVDNIENKLLITEGSSMKSSPITISDTLTFTALKDENSVEINLLNNTDVVLDRVNSYSFFSSTDNSGLSIYISESFVVNNSHSLESGKIILDTLSDRSGDIYILTDSNIYHGTNPNNIDEFKNNAETPVPFDVSNMNSFCFDRYGDMYISSEINPVIKVIGFDDNSNIVVKSEEATTTVMEKWSR